MLLAVTTPSTKIFSLKDQKQEVQKQCLNIKRKDYVTYQIKM